MLVILYDNELRNKLYPLSLTKAVGLMRCGILTAQERWSKIFDSEVMVHVPVYLQILYSDIPAGEHLWIDAAVLPDAPLVDALLSLENDHALFQNNQLIAARTTIAANDFNAQFITDKLKPKNYKHEVNRVIYPWHFFQMNHKM